MNSMISARDLLITNGTFNQNLLTNPRGFELLTQHVAAQALHDSGEVSDPAKCHPDTRVAILADLEEWAQGAVYNYPIKWVTGSAGVGKTAIMRSTAEALKSRKLLLAAFFFWRTGERCNTAKYFIATLAYQIAISIPATRPYIERAIEQNPHIFTQTLEAQSRALIVDPIAAICRERALPPNYPRIFVIDGLDECLDAARQFQDTEKQCEVLRTLQWTLQQLPTPFALLLASRPEYHIQTVFDNGLKNMSSTLILNDFYNMHDDIRRFFIDKFREIREHHPLRSYLPSPEWPSPNIVDLLVKRADGQFIYASTVIKFIATNRKNPSHQLDCILDANIRGNVRPFQPLDILYSTILSTIDKDDLHLVLRVIGILFCVQRPHPNTPPSFWDRFLGLNLGEVERVMLGLESLLLVRGTNGQTFRFYHASLQEFLLDSSRSGPFFIDTPMVYEDLAKQSILRLSAIDDDIEKFIFEGLFSLESWFKDANPSVELHNATEQARISIRSQDLKWKYPVFLNAIVGSQLPAKEHLYATQLDIYHSRLNEFLPPYIKDTSLMFLLLVRTSCADVVYSRITQPAFDKLCGENLSEELKDIDREKGLHIYGNQFWGDRRGHNLQEAFLIALREVVAKTRVDIGDLYAKVALSLVKSLTQHEKYFIEKVYYVAHIFGNLLSQASYQSDLVESLKSSPILGNFLEWDDRRWISPIQKYLQRIPVPALGEFMQSSEDVGMDVNCGQTTIKDVTGPSIDYTNKAVDERIDKDSDGFATAPVTRESNVKNSSWPTGEMGSEIFENLRRSTRKRGSVDKPSLNMCLCGLVADPSAEGVVKCKRTTCDTQWYHSICTGKTQLLQNWVCEACTSARRGKRLRK